MIADEYEKILSALDSASHVLKSNQGDLSAADMRIRCLVNITAKEAKRALLEIGGGVSPDRARELATQATASDDE